MKRRRTFLLPAALVSAVVAFVYFAGPGPHTGAESEGLYADDDIRRFVPHDIATATRGARSLLAVPYLDVVPAGDTRPRREVFQTLGLDEGRVRDFRMRPADHVVFLRWQVSASYDGVCMTASDAWNAGAVAFADPERPVYGIRLVDRSEASRLIW